MADFRINSDKKVHAKTAESRYFLMIVRRSVLICPRGVSLGFNDAECQIIDKIVEINYLFDHLSLGEFVDNCAEQ